MRLSAAVPVAVLTCVLAAGCGSTPQPAESAKPAADAPFTAVAGEYLEDYYRRQPTFATYLGVHKYDDQLESYSRQAAMDGVAKYAAQAVLQARAAVARRNEWCPRGDSNTRHAV